MRSNQRPLDRRHDAFSGGISRRMPIHPLLIAMAACFLGLQAAQSLAAAGYAPAVFDSWHLMKRYAFFGIVFEQALDGRGLAPQLPASLVTYAFLHVDWLHVALNTVVILPLGEAVTRAVGALRMLAGFALTVMAGAVAFGLMTDIVNPLVGASAAVFGFLGMITAWQERRLARRGKSRMRIWHRIVGLAMLNAAVEIGLTPLFAWEAHLGGFVAGWLLALLWRPQDLRRPA